MRTLLRTLLYLALVVWLGAVAFFPVIASVTFGTLAGDRHTAGSIVGALLRILHGTGLVAGIVALALLALAPAFNMYRPRSVLAPMVLLVFMLVCTAYSQFVIIPAMERDRLGAGGAIDVQDLSNPVVLDFNRLHGRSEHVEAAILLLGIAAVACVAHAESTRV